VSCLLCTLLQHKDVAGAKPAEATAPTAGGFNFGNVSFNFGGAAAAPAPAAATTGSVRPKLTDATTPAAKPAPAPAATVADDEDDNPFPVGLASRGAAIAAATAPAPAAAAPAPAAPVAAAPVAQAASDSAAANLAREVDAKLTTADTADASRPPDPDAEKNITGLLHTLQHNVEVSLADQQADVNSPLYSAKTFEELNLYASSHIGTKPGGRI